MSDIDSRTVRMTRKDLQAMYDSMTLQQIADRFNASTQWASSLAAKHNITTPGRYRKRHAMLELTKKLESEYNMKFRDIYHKFRENREIYRLVERMECTKTTFRKFIKSLGLESGKYKRHPKPVIEIRD
jgi:hypothetical protein